VIVERQDANAQAYLSNVSAKQILSGTVSPPDWAQPFIRTLESCTIAPGGRAWVPDDQRSSGSQYAFRGIASSNSEVPQSLRQQKRKPPRTDTFPPDSWGIRSNSGGYPGPPTEEAVSGSAWDYDRAPALDSPPPFETHFDNDFEPASRPSVRHTPGRSLDSSIGTGAGARLQSAHTRSSSSAAKTANPFYSQAERETDGYAIRSSSFGPTLEDDDNPFGTGTRAVDAAAAQYREVERERALSKPLAQGEGVGRAIALFDFRAVEPGDLSFSKGQVITIIEKSDSTDTW
jgi:SH3 domain-containing YSC84-like protein 1